MGDDLKKIFWIVVAIGIIGIFATFVVAPAVDKIKDQQTAIEDIDFSSGTGTTPP